MLDQISVNTSGKLSNSYILVYVVNGIQMSELIKSACLLMFTDATSSNAYTLTFLSYIPYLVLLNDNNNSTRSFNYTLRRTWTLYEDCTQYYYL